MHVPTSPTTSGSNLNALKGLISIVSACPFRVRSSACNGVKLQERAMILPPHTTVKRVHRPGDVMYHVGI